MRFFIVFLLFIGFAPSLKAQSISYLLDSETNHYFKNMLTPFLPTQGLTAQDLTFYLVNSDEINAFVTPERSIYVYSGLVLKAKTAAEVQGVLTHELAHLLGYHNAKRQADSGKGRNTLIIGTLAGLGAMLAGAPQAGAAIALGSQAALINSILKYSRAQERDADRIAITLLHKQNLSVSGLQSFFKKLRGDELLYSRTPPEYLLTHPLTSSRLQLMQDQFAQEKNKQAFQDPWFKRMQAKIFAMTKTPMQTLRRYREQTPPHIYAKAIAYALKGNTKKAQPLAEKLIASAPKDIYYQELMAQIYVDSGQLKKALPFFEKALNLSNGTHPLIHYQYGKTLLDLNKINAALPHLLRAKDQLPKWAEPWYMIGIAYGQQNLLTESHIALAEAALLRHRMDEVKVHIAIAEKNIAGTSPQTQNKLKSLKEFIEKAEKE